MTPDRHDHVMAQGVVTTRRQRAPTMERITRSVLGIHASDLSEPPAGRWNSELVIDDFDKYLTALETDIANAQRIVLLEVYILGNDVIGHRVERALIAAAKRGVQVLLTVDGIGSADWIDRRAVKLDQAGVRVRVYHPPPWQVTRFSVSTRARLAFAGRWLRYVNRRNHRKFCIIDGQVAWLGSMNLVRNHSRAESGDKAWRDTVARVEGPCIDILAHAFFTARARSWRFVGAQLYPRFTLKPIHPPLPRHGLIRLNHGLKNRTAYYHDLLARIRRARKRVWIANAYFVPLGGLFDALCAAAQHGVDVRIIVPAHSDVWFMPYVAATFADALARGGVHLFSYQPSMLHSKTILIDDWVSIGSTNLNNRSLRHDLEADVVLTTPTSLHAIEHILADDCKNSVEITTGSHRPWLWVRLIGHLALLLRRWI